MDAVQPRRWRRAMWKTLAVVGAVGALSVGVANPAHAERSGTWSSDVWYVHWSAAPTYTYIEPHMFDTAYAVVARYTGSGVTYSYGHGARNNAVTHNTDYVYNSTGTYIGNYFSHQGSLFQL